MQTYAYTILPDYWRYLHIFSTSLLFLTTSRDFAHELPPNRVYASRSAKTAHSDATREHKFALVTWLEQLGNEKGQ